MDPVAKAYDAAEQAVFPPVPEDQVWCSIRGKNVGVGTCVDSCAAPEQRPVCWLGKRYRDEPEAPEEQ